MRTVLRTAAAAACVLCLPATAQQQQQQAVFTSTAAHPPHTLTRIHAHSTHALQRLHRTATRTPGCDLWAAHTAGCAQRNASACAIDIAATPHALAAYLHDLGDTAARSHTLIPDIGALVQQQHAHNARIHAAYVAGDTPRYDEDWHAHYHSYSEIQDYLEHIAHTYPTHAQLINLGTTHEGRALTALKLTHPAPAPAPADAKPKLGVLVMANQHAREWISAATALHLIHQIITDELADPIIEAASKRSRRKANGRKAWAGGAVDLLEVFDITVLPLANPDGYAYSWEAERMWRKNRQPVADGEDGAGCVGIDINSNWDAHFQPWPLSQACAESFPGTRAFEARESSAIARFIGDAANHIHSVIDLHSYGQLLTYPFAFSCSPSLALPDEEDLLELSFGAVKAMRDVHSRTFHAGRHCELAWELRGSALDWSYGWFPAPPPAEEDELTALVRGKVRRPRRAPIAPSSSASARALQPRAGNLVKWSFALELRDGGTYGFLLPPEQIRPSGEEAGALMRYSLEFIAKRERRL